MKKRLNKLDEYRLTKVPCGYEWQDKRDESGIIYRRDFYSAYDLLNFLTDYFGARTLKKVWHENAGILPPL